MYINSFRNDVSLGNLKNNASMYATQVNDGQITHYPYEIGSQITIANTHYQYYQLKYDEDMAEMKTVIL